MSDAWLEELTLDECRRLLADHEVGRLAMIVDDWPMVVPVNYRFVDVDGLTWVALRTRPGNIIDRAASNVAFEIDAIDPGTHEGWSVVVRGTLHHVDAAAAGFAERFDPVPWLLEERDAWLVVQAFFVTGRRLHAHGPGWVLDAEPA